MELINCHDCGKAVSSRASACPYCESDRPTGSYFRRAARRLRIEKRKYRLIMIALAVGIAVGLIYGAVPFAAVVKLIGS
jgi:hypothetical protein